jgi:hypothetical protein
MRTIRASEIGAYLYCQRAWWYQIQGFQSQNDSLMAGGTEFHQRHGREILTIGCLRYLAYSLILLSLALGAIYLTRHFI